MRHWTQALLPAALTATFQTFLAGPAGAHPAGEVSPAGRRIAPPASAPSPATRGWVTTRAGNGAVRALYGTEPSWTAAVALGAGGMAFGDADGDGLPDLAIGTYAGGYPTPPDEDCVFRYQGDTLESSPSWVASAGDWTTAVTWLLIDSLDRPGLLAVNGGPSGEPPVIYQNGADGLSTSPTWTSANPNAASGLDGAVGDVNGDGVVDVFIASQCYDPCTGTANVGYLSSGGTLPTAPSWVSENEGQFSGAALGDVDGSARTALTRIATGDGIRRLFWLPGAPIAAVQRVLVNGAPAGPVSVNLEMGSVVLATAPAAGSAVEIRYLASTELDLVTAANPGGLILYRHSGTSLATAPEWVVQSADVGYESIALVDLDLDGSLELVAAGSTDTPCHAFRFESGGFNPAPIWTGNESGCDAQDLVIFDANGDGWPDVATVTFAGETVASIFINQGGALEATASETMPWGGYSVASAAAGDVNGDALEDLAMGYANGQASIFTNTGAHLPVPTITAVSPTSGEGPLTLTITGTGFAGPATVWVGDQALETTVASATEITASLPAGLAGGAFDVFVVNRDLQAAVRADGFTSTAAVETPDAGVLPDGAPGGETDDDDGCSCRVGSRQGGTGAGGALLVLLGLLAAPALTRGTGSKR